MAPREVRVLHPYEVLVIVDSRPTDEEVAALLTQLGEQLKSLGGDVTKVENWGKRRLAYDIGKQREGTYAVFEVSAEPATIREFERQLQAQRARLALPLHPDSGSQAGSAGENSRVPTGGGHGRGQGTRGGRLMASLNKVLLIGNLTRPPELRYTPSGTAVADLRLAVNRNYTTQGGEKREEACFLTVVVWGKQAESVWGVSGQGQPGLRRGAPADARLGKQGRPETNRHRGRGRACPVHEPHEGRRGWRARDGPGRVFRGGRWRRRRRRALLRGRTAIRASRSRLEEEATIPTAEAHEAASVRPAQGLQVLRGQGRAWSTTRTSAACGA